MPLETALTDRIQRRAHFTMNPWHPTLRVCESELERSHYRRIAPVARHFGRIERSQIGLHDRGKLIQTTEFLSNFNNLPVRRPVGRCTAISQQISHGARMIRTSAATVKAPVPASLRKY